MAENRHKRLEIAAKIFAILWGKLYNSNVDS